MARRPDRFLSSIDPTDGGSDRDDVLAGGRLEIVEPARSTDTASIRLAELIERMSEPRSESGLDRVARLIAEALASESLEPRHVVR